MNINYAAIGRVVQKAFSKVRFKFRKHSPDILFTAGMVGVVGGTVMVGVASSKVKEVAAEAKEVAEKELIDIKESDLPDVEKRAKIAKVYAKYGLKFVKLYAPSVTVMALSGTSLICSHVQLKERTAALAAAYTTAVSNLRKYQKYVEEKYGEGSEQLLEEGKKSEKKKEVEEKKLDNYIDKHDIEPYSFLFDERSRYWDRNSELSLASLQCVEKYLTTKLRARGYLFLSDVLEELGLPATKFSRMVGWIYAPYSQNWKGDGYIDFGIGDRNNPGVRRFMNGEPNIWLNFNCDGYIMSDFEAAAEN